MFKKSFERRLTRLSECIIDYFASGKEGNLLPSLFSVFSYLWCKSPYKSR